MLKKIPKILSPSLVKALMEMGHGDELIIADGNYPAFSQGVQVIDGDGHNVIDYLEAILEYFHLDSYSDKSVVLMSVVPGDDTVPTVWEDYKKVIIDAGYSSEVIGHVERFDFYERSKKSYLIIATSDKALYANILLKKGVV